MFDHFYVGQYRCTLEGATLGWHVAKYKCESSTETRFACVPKRMRESLSANCHDGDAPQIAMALAGRVLCTGCNGAEYAVAESPALTDYPGSYLVAVDCEHCGGDGWEPLPS